MPRTTAKPDPADPAVPVPAPEADADRPDFDPVAVRARADGWTPERQQRFIEGLADTGSVTKAALGLGMSPEGAYRLRRRPDAAGFNEAWDAALAVATRRLVDAAFERALDGVDNPVFHKGEVIGSRRAYSDRLLMFLLKHHDPVVYGNLSGVPFDPMLVDKRAPRIRRFPDLVARLLGMPAKVRPEVRPSSRRT